MLVPVIFFSFRNCSLHVYISVKFLLLCIGLNISCVIRDLLGRGVAASVHSPFQTSSDVLVVTY
jgi:hypothetical protein